MEGPDESTKLRWHPNFYKIFLLFSLHPNLIKFKVNLFFVDQKLFYTKRKEQLNLLQMSLA